MDYKAILLKTLSQCSWPHYGLTIKDPYFTWWNAENETQMFGVWVADYAPETLQTAFTHLEAIKAIHDANPDDIPMGASYLFCMARVGSPQSLLEYANIPDLEFLVVADDGSYGIYYSDGTGGLHYDASSDSTFDMPDSIGFKMAIQKRLNAS